MAPGPAGYALAGVPQVITRLRPGPHLAAQRGDKDNGHKKTKNLIEVVKGISAEFNVARCHSKALQEAVDAFEHDEDENETRQILSEIREAMGECKLIDYLMRTKSTGSAHRALNAAIDAWLEKHAE